MLDSGRPVIQNVIHMAGTVRRRGSRWQALLSFRDPANPGKLVQYTATRATRREAEKALAELVIKRDRGRLVRGNETFGDAAARWRKTREQTAAPSSLLRWDIALRTYLVPKFGGVPLRKLTPDLLD